MATIASSGRKLQETRCKGKTTRGVSSKELPLLRAASDGRIEHHHHRVPSQAGMKGHEEEQTQVVLQAECACCGLSEECTPGYIARVKEIFCGRWVCGLCAEAVKEEHRRRGKGSAMEEALQAHMELSHHVHRCKEQPPPPPSLVLAGALRHLLRRHLQDAADATTPSSSSSHLTRSCSCLPALSNPPRMSPPLCL